MEEGRGRRKWRKYIIILKKIEEIVFSEVVLFNGQLTEKIENFKNSHDNTTEPLEPLFKNEKEMNYQVPEDINIVNQKKSVWKMYVLYSSKCLT